MILDELFPGRECDHGMCDNLLISGDHVMGGKACFRNILTEFMTDRHPLLMMHCGIEAADHLFLSSLAGRFGYRIHTISLSGADGKSFDLLSTAADAQEKALLISHFLFDEKDSRADRDTACRFLRDAALMFYYQGKQGTMRQILNTDPEEVHTFFLTCTELGERFQQEELRFLTSGAVHASRMLLDVRATNLAESGLLDRFSGTVPAGIYFRETILLLICAPRITETAADATRRLFNGMACFSAHLLKVFNELHRPYHAAICGSSLFSTAELNLLLDTCSQAVHQRIGLCMYQEKITDLLKYHDSYLIHRFGCYAVFSTTSGEFWSEVFGKGLKPEIARSYTQKKNGYNPIGGGVIARPSGKYTGTSVSMVQKPHYEASAFSSLQRNAYLWYLVRKNRRGQRRLEA